MVHASVDVDQNDPESWLARLECSLGIWVSPVRYTFVKFREKSEREATILWTKLPVGLKDDQIIIGKPLSLAGSELGKIHAQEQYCPFPRCSIQPISKENRLSCSVILKIPLLHL